jgi:hypothetical protein
LTPWAEEERLERLLHAGCTGRGQGLRAQVRSCATSCFISRRRKRPSWHLSIEELRGPSRPSYRIKRPDGCVGGRQRNGPSGALASVGGSRRIMEEIELHHPPPPFRTSLAANCWSTGAGFGRRAVRLLCLVYIARPRSGEQVFAVGVRILPTTGAQSGPPNLGMRGERFSPSWGTIRARLQWVRPN